jgi:Tfp pilus assembly ATPase PilU
LDGMQDFDTVIREMIERKIITVEDGLGFATNQNNLLLSLKGLSSSEDYIRSKSESIPAPAFVDSGSLLSMID